VALSAAGVVAQGVTTIPVSSLGAGAKVVGVVGVDKYVYTVSSTSWNPSYFDSDSKSYIVEGGVARELSFVANGVGRDGAIYGFRMEGGLRRSVVSDGTGSSFKGFTYPDGLGGQEVTDAIGDFAVVRSYSGGGDTTNFLVGLDGTNRVLAGSSVRTYIESRLLNGNGYFLQNVSSSTFNQSTVFKPDGSQAGVKGATGYGNTNVSIFGMDGANNIFYRTSTVDTPSGFVFTSDLIKRNLATGAESTFSGEDPFGIFLGSNTFYGTMNDSGAILGTVRAGMGGPVSFVYYSPIYGWHNLSEEFSVSGLIGRTYLSDDGQIGWEMLRLSSTGRYESESWNMVASPVPEPGLIGAFGIGILALLRRRRKTKA
jgi:hypothetical protein